jgi:hypothetical protein
VILAQVEGIPVLYSVIPYLPPFRGDVFQSVIVICDLCWPRLTIDRFDIRQFIWENVLDMIELVSFLDAVEGA